MLKISIIMACYNESERIKDAIESIISQTYDNWEIIIIDDASTDNSVSIVEEIIKNNIEIKFFKNKKNKGCGYTKRRAVENSSGEIIIILDADDKFAHDNVLEKVIKCHQNHPKASMTYSNSAICKEGFCIDYIVKSFQIEKGKFYLDKLSKNDRDIPKVGSLLSFKKRFYNKTEGINAELRQTEDKDLVIKLEEIGRLIFIDEVLYLIRKHKNSITNKPKARKMMKKNKKLICENAIERRKNKKSVGRSLLLQKI